jgi:membrane associated rhomboid family serine protease
MFSMPPVTQVLILLNIAAFLMDSVVGDALMARLALWPIGSPYFGPWQLVTYAFLHGNLSHILFNMFGVYMFGSDLERVWGSKRYLQFYFASLLAAGITQEIVSYVTGARYPTVGASGAVFGLLIGFAMVFPRRMVVPLIPPIPMRAPVFVAIYGALELVLGVTGTQQGVAHFAHLGGLAGGWLMLQYWRAR